MVFADPVFGEGPLPAYRLPSPSVLYMVEREGVKVSVSL